MSVELVTILFSDLVGSTKLASQVGPTRAEELRREHFRVLRKAVAESDGKEVKNLGDGLMVAFTSASAATRCAVTMQQLIERRNRGDAQELHVRIGLGAGEATVEDGDYFGMPSIEAARLCSHAATDGILGSTLVRMLAGRGEDMRFESVGMLDLKGIPEPVEAFAVGWEPLSGGLDDDAPLVGRRRELLNLEAALADARRGSGCCWLVTGEAGIGKTRLAQALAARAGAIGVPALWGRAWDGGGAPAFWPWVQIIRELSADRDPRGPAAALGAGAPWLVQLVPELRDRLPDVEPPPAVDAEHARFALFDALLGFLRSAAARTPLLVVLDDIDAADDSSLLALEYVARSIADAPLLIVGTARTPFAAAGDAGEETRSSGVVRASRVLALRGLASDDLAELVGVHVDAQADEALVRALHTATGGNPFYATEVLRLLAEQDRLPARGTAPLPLPESARDAIRRRLAPLPEPARDALRTGAVIGLEFRLATVQRVTGLSRSDLVSVLDQALASGVLVERGGLLGHLRFAHGIIRDTLYASLRPADRARVHARVGAAIEELYPGDLEVRVAELAHHFLEAALAGDPEKAIDYAERAGRRAMDLLAFEEAADLFEAALGALELAPDAGRRAVLIHALGVARLRAGDPEARAVLLEAAGAARRLRDGRLLADVALCFGALALSPGLVDSELVELLDEALAAVGDEPTVLRTRLLSRLAVALYWSDEIDRRRALADEALTLARELGDPAALAFALANHQLVRAGPDTAEQDLRTLAELFVLTRRSGDRDLELTARSRQIDILLEVDDLGGAETAIAALAEATAERGDPRARAYVPLHRSRQALIEGRFGQAERLTADAARIGAHLRDSTVPMLVITQGLILRWIHGRLVDATDELRGLAAAVPAVSAVRAALALALAVGGDAHAARRELDALAPNDLPRNSIYLLSLAFLAEACAALGDVDRAERIASLLEPYDGRNVVSPVASFAGAVARYLALLAGTRGDWPAATAHFAAAREAATRHHSTPMLARLALDEAQLLTRAGRDPERAAALATEAARHARAVGMPVIERLALEGASAGPVPADDRPAPTSAAPDSATLRRTGEDWVIEHGTAAVRVPDGDGMRMLAALLDRPGEQVPATELGGVDDPGAGLDDAAIAAYRRRLAHLRDEVDEGEALGHPEWAPRAEEIAFIERELTGMEHGRGDAAVRTEPPSERARARVTRAIRLATRLIGESDRSLGRQLDATITTGTMCAYQPDPRHPITWQVDG